MNQILFPNNNYESNTIKSKNTKIYKLIIIISFFIIFICIILLCFTKYNSYNNSKTSSKLLNNFNITTLYSTESDKLSTKLINNIPNSFVIGIIEINKINLCYPILSSTSPELLNIAVCKFYGPMPNQIGNLCLAGHNNLDNTIFGKLNQLKINDIINIYDLSGNKIEYILKEKKEVPEQDLSCTNQNTNGKKIVTLITCNTFNGRRVIYTCEEINKE